MNGRLKGILAGVFILLIVLLLLSKCSSCRNNAPDHEDFGTGPIQVTIDWDFPGDIDLHVIQPDGQEIYFANSRARGRHGGHLDHDEIEGGRGSAENVYWSNPATGRYIVKVKYYSVNEDAPNGGNVLVTVKLNGEQTRYNVNMTTQNQEVEVAAIDYPNSVTAL